MIKLSVFLAVLAIIVYLTVIQKPFSDFKVYQKVLYIYDSYDLFISGHLDEVLVTLIVEPLLFTGSKDKTVRIWDLASKKQVGILEGHSAGVNVLEMWPEHGVLITGSWDGTIRLWNLRFNLQIAVLTGHSDWVTGIKILKDKNQLVSSSRDSTLKIWDLQTFSLIKTLDGHKGHVWSLAVSTDAKYLVSGSADKTIIVWDLEKYEKLMQNQVSNSQINSLDISRDNKLVITGGKDDEAKIWDLKTGEKLKTLNGIGKTRYAKIIENNTALVVNSENLVVLWDIEQEKAKSRFTLNECSQTTRSFFVDDQMKMLVFSCDTEIKARDLHSSEEINIVDNFLYLEDVEIAKNKNHAVALYEGSKIAIWDLSNKEILHWVYSESDPLAKDYPEISKLYLELKAFNEQYN